MENLAAYMTLEQAFVEAYRSASHMVTGHLMVGDFRGFFKGIIDYTVDHAAMLMFHYTFMTCYFYTLLYTMFANDEGVAFYRCYKNFAANTAFY